MSGTLDPSTEGGARTLARLATELIGWLTTTNPDGQPQSSPIWFEWLGDEILIYSRKRAPRNGNVSCPVGPWKERIAIRIMGM